MSGQTDGVVSRLKTWWGAFLAPAEDPRKIYADAYGRQYELLSRVRQALAEVGGAKGRLEAKTVEVRAKLAQLENQARDDLRAGQEGLARLAVQRYEVGMVEIRALEEQIQDVEREERRLAVVEQRLSTQLEAFRAREEVLAARYSAAEAQVQIKEALGGISQELSDLGNALEQAEEKTERMQARATALDRLVEAGVLPSPEIPTAEPLEGPLAQVDVAAAVEAHLAALKGKIVTNVSDRPPSAAA